VSRSLWPVLTGFSLWAVAFTGLYALQYLGCRFAWDPGLHRLALIGGYGLALALIGALLALQLVALRRRDAPADALRTIGIGATVAALFATAFTFAPILIASACL
jgi:hypothetical protein